MGFPTWEPAKRCSSGPQPGTEAFMRWVMEEYQARGAMNWGIFNCRSVRGGSTTSVHGEGRASDVGFPIGDPDGDDLLRRLLMVPGRLGIQCIIYERVIYSAVSPKGRPYNGVAPHFDHLHIEQTWESARNLTYATVKRVMARTEHPVGSRPLVRGDEGSDVMFVQKVVGATIDGVFGPRTENAVLRWERVNKQRVPRLLVDGKVGRITWAAMGVTPTYGNARRK